MLLILFLFFASWGGDADPKDDAVIAEFLVTGAAVGFFDGENRLFAVVFVKGRVFQAYPTDQYQQSIGFGRAFLFRRSFAIWSGFSVSLEADRKT